MRRKVESEDEEERAGATEQKMVMIRYLRWREVDVEKNEKD